MTLQRLADVVSGHAPNAIMPLFWQKGGPVEVVREEMERIADAGIGAVILEARPHPEFLGEGWWRDVDAVLEIARRRDMKVWFFDDDTFPTGHAAGAVEQAPEELKRRFLTERHTDVVGPMRGASLIVDRRKFFGPEPSLDAGRLIRVLAFRRGESSEELIGTALDLTDRIIDGVINWDIPDGWWRVFFVSLTADGGSARHAGHIDYLNGDSTQLLIDTVYEPIRERYPDEFGNLIAGFFSDEPGLYNDPDTFDFGSSLGKPVPLPWNDELLSRLSKKLGEDALPLLPLLWWPAEHGAERCVRYAFMDVISELYSQNFSRRLGDWCRSRGVQYIGHVIEDNGAHARLGPGAGHYFRAMAGQDMAGIDIIGGQVVPGFGHGPFANLSGAADGEFFHFGLAKLASSAAHLDPLKKGRSMCETIGAYGWYAGLRLFTWLTNHLLVRGVTHVVPHAFSPAPFPDLDCPPHFYAHGRNPQYRYHHLLSAYTNRLSHLLQGGVHVAPFAVLYHADAEWLGAAMPSERPMRLLMEAQLDADILPADSLPDARVAGVGFVLGDETYDALVVPGSEFLPGHIAAQLLRLDDAGVPVVFVGDVPEVVGAKRAALRERFRGVAADELVEAVSELTTRGVRAAEAVPSLRVYRRDQGAADVVMLFNESVDRPVRTAIAVPRPGEAIVVDGFTGSCTGLPNRGTSTILVDIDLAPGAAMVLVCGDPSAWAGLTVLPPVTPGAPIEATIEWAVATATAEEYPDFSPWANLPQLVPLSAPDLLPRFSGTLRYTGAFPASAEAGASRLDLGEVFEIAQVWLDGVDLGTRITPPYLFDVPAGALSADSVIEVEVTNTLAKQQRDFFSAFAQQDPTGLLGPITIAAVRTDIEASA